MEDAIIIVRNVKNNNHSIQLRIVIIQHFNKFGIVRIGFLIFINDLVILSNILIFQIYLLTSESVKFCVLQAKCKYS